MTAALHLIWWAEGKPAAHLDDGRVIVVAQPTGTPVSHLVTRAPVRPQRSGRDGAGMGSIR
ncbi:hypothetical protein [Streptomyces sp. NPDC059743]|uniref:hypothetical protein n=1 Tax=Streptomyces sp. NPDC059743 TaxID=3346928 RepID=UPI003651B7E0